MSDVIRFPQPSKSNSLTDFGLTKADDACNNLDIAELYDRIDEENHVDTEQRASEANVSFLTQSRDTSGPASGWTNQELADLYRTQRILALAGVTTQVDDGVTDEGDPWFVFMDCQHEVLVHFSRFDGFYLVTSRMQEEPIKGGSLHDLVSQFSRRVQPVTQAGQNVVSLARNNQGVVFIHPAAALAALVWSVYLMADELIAATPAAAEGTLEGSHLHLDNAPEEAFTAHAEPQEAPSNMPHKAPTQLFEHDAAKVVPSSSTSREGLAVGLSGHGAKVAGVSLSLVALAVGLPLPTGSILEAASSDASVQKVSIEGLSEALASVKSKEAALLMASDTAELQPRELASSELTEEVEAATSKIDGEAETPLKIQGLVAPNIEQAGNFLYIEPEKISGLALQSEEALLLKKSSDTPEGETEASMLGSSESLEEISFLQVFDKNFESLSITALDKIEKTELAQLLDANDEEISSGPTNAFHIQQGFEAFDLDAREFLDFLLHTYDDVKVLNLKKEIVFIHMGAFEEKGEAHEVYAKSWSFDDGGIISTIGFKSDMAQFDLIA